MRSPELSLDRDSRGVSEVIGFLLVFSILIILLSINQAQIVPQQNSEIEFQHYQNVQDDMVAVRSSISTAGQANVSQYPTVELGTSYPSRLFALNPPAPAGTLRTSQEYDIRLGNGTNSETVGTRFLVYQPRYNELEAQPIRYENSVLYIDARDSGGGVAVLEEQNLVRGGGRVRITAVQNEFSETSTGRVTIEIYPTEDTDVDLEDWTGDVTVEIPTRLDGTEYWDEELGGSGVYDGVNENGVEPGVHLLSLTVDADSLKFNTVGIESAPDGQGSASRGIGVGGEGGGGGGGGGGTCTIGSNNNPNTFQWNNLDGFEANGGPDTWEISQINVQSQAGNDLEELKLEIEDSGGTVRATRTTQLPANPQYQEQNIDIDPDDPGYNIPQGNQQETYTLTATICDVDGNSNSQTRQATS